MRKALLRVAMATALCAPTAAHAVDAIYGVWVREGHPDDKLEFYDCAGKLCAKGIEPMPDGSPPPQVLKNAAKTTPNHWEGELDDPESGKTYIGKIALDSPTAADDDGLPRRLPMPKRDLDEGFRPHQAGGRGQALRTGACRKNGRARAGGQGARRA